MVTCCVDVAGGLDVTDSWVKERETEAELSECPAEDGGWKHTVDRLEKCNIFLLHDA